MCFVITLQIHIYDLPQFHSPSLPRCLLKAYRPSSVDVNLMLASLDYFDFFLLKTTISSKLGLRSWLSFFFFQCEGYDGLFPMRSVTILLSVYQVYPTGFFGTVMATSHFRLSGQVIAYPGNDLFIFRPQSPWFIQAGRERESERERGWRRGRKRGGGKSANRFC